MAIRWYGLVAPEQAPTGDRRMFAAGALTFRQMPLPASWQRVSGQGHNGSVVVASWDREYAGAGGVWGSGVFLDPRIVPEVVEAIYLLEKKLIGPSVDLDPDLAYEVVDHPVLADEYARQVTRATTHGVTFVQGPAFPQVHITVDDEEEMSILASAGITIAEFSVNRNSWSSWPVAERETPFDADAAIARIAAWSGGDAKRFAQAFLWKDDKGNPTNRETYRLPLADVVNDRLVLIPRAVMSAATIMSGAHGGLYDTVPENERSQIQQVLTTIYDRLRDDYGDPRFIAPWQRGGRAGATSSDAEPTQASLDALTAAGVLAPPKAFFSDPRLDGPTKLRITEDGRVYGHLATWKTCHTAVGKKCQLAPRSNTAYKHFKTGSVKTAEGDLLSVGHLTVGTGHADQKYGVIPAAEHYDNTGVCVAVVNAGEDRFGVWVAGALVADVSENRVAELRRSPLSGDWRRVDGNLELVAALAVNNPGFPIHEEDSDGVLSLTAAGVLVDAEAEDLEFTDLGFLGKVDAFLAESERSARVAAVQAAYHDLLPDTVDCGCNG